MLNYEIKTIPTLINHTTVSDGNRVYSLVYLQMFYDRAGGLKENGVVMSCLLKE